MDLKKSYSLTFQMPYETEPGQSVCLVGGIYELGNWNDFNTQLTWNEGHIWKLENV